MQEMYSFYTLLTANRETKYQNVVHRGTCVRCFIRTYQNNSIR